jgi:ABC-type multidrug transport system fused ATPase/permease subunit
LYVYVLDATGEGITAKRRGQAVLPMATIPWLTRRQSIRFHQCHKSIQESFAGLTEASRDSLNAIRLIKVFDLTEGKDRQFERLAQVHLDNNMALARVSALYLPVMTLVGQEMILLAASIEENIVLGRSEVTPSMLARAIRISGVDTWIGALSQGIKTRIGESGRSLSQGQCQMLSLARALVGDPRILILDEAFSQIDPASEKLIISRLPSIMAGRTCITVARRLATARYSQRILVVRKGCIVEDGEHQALMDANGIYASMVTLERLHRRKDAVGGHEAIQGIKN